MYNKNGPPYNDEVQFSHVLRGLNNLVNLCFLLVQWPDGQLDISLAQRLAANAVAANREARNGIAGARNEKNTAPRQDFLAVMLLASCSPSIFGLFSSHSGSLTVFSGRFA